MEARQAAELAHLAYVDHMEMEEEEERRQRYEDEADYYACVEADLWRGWRDEYEEELKLGFENDSPTGCLSKKVIEDH